MTDEIVICHAGACIEPAHPAHDPCCSSHGQPLCCQHYRRFHFVETACGHERVPKGHTMMKLILSLVITAATAVAGIPAPANAAVGTYTILIGDSLANYGKDNLAGYRPTWEVDAINGSSPATLSGRIDAAVLAHGGQDPATIIVELGTNYSSTFTPDDYSIVRTKLPATRIVFVTPGRDPFVVGAESARRAAAYAYYMIRLANVDPRMCITPWAEAVAANPALLRDGVHATPEAEDRWAREIVKGTDACRTTEP